MRISLARLDPLHVNTNPRQIKLLDIVRDRGSATVEQLAEMLGVTLQTVRRQLNPSLVLTGIAITMADDRTRLSQDVEHELKDHFTDLVLATSIPRSVRLAEAPSFGLPVIAHAPESRGAVAYRALAEEVLARG